MIQIRDAQKSDFKAIFNLVVELAVYEKEPEAVTASISDYERSYDDGLIHAKVAIENDTVIGMALYYMTFSTWKGKMLYLEDFYVKAEYRSSGVGQKLFDAYIAAAHSLGCKMTKWQVIDWNTKAIKFYERNGATIERNWFNAKIIF